MIASGVISAADVTAYYNQTTAFAVAENSANGTVIGSVVGTDAESTSALTYSLSNNAGGRFAINTTTGEITVANSTLLDYETNTSHSITVRVTDASGLTYDKTFTVAVTNVNDRRSHHLSRVRPSLIPKIRPRLRSRRHWLCRIKIMRTLPARRFKSRATMVG